MTKFEQEIVKILQEDGRASYKQIAEMLSAGEDKVKAAVEKLEKDGVILKYSAIVADDEFFGDTVQALIEVKVSPMKEKGYDEIAGYVSGFDEVKSLYLMSGAYDLAIFIEAKNLREVARFVSEKLSLINSVQSVATHFILKKYKLSGTTIGAEKDRLLIQP